MTGGYADLCLCCKVSVLIFSLRSAISSFYYVEKISSNGRFCMFLERRWPGWRRWFQLLYLPFLDSVFSVSVYWIWCCLSSGKKSMFQELLLSFFPSLLLPWINYDWNGGLLLVIEMVVDLVICMQIVHHPHQNPPLGQNFQAEFFEFLASPWEGLPLTLMNHADWFDLMGLYMNLSAVFFRSWIYLRKIRTSLTFVPTGAVFYLWNLFFKKILNKK